jgi:hypothetical protein
LAIKEALESSGKTKEANKAYLEFIKANFFIPLEKNTSLENPQVLFLQDSNGTFLPVFSNKECFDAWVSEISDEVQVLTLTGVDLLKGIGDEVTVCLNPGSPLYKAFNPSEIARMRSMVLKIFQ